MVEKGEELGSLNYAHPHRAADARPPSADAVSLVGQARLTQGRAVPVASDHACCLDLAKLVRGTLCAALFRGPTRHVQASGRIFRPGEAADELFLIHSGLVKLTAVSPAGEEMTVEVFGPADVFGEMCFREHVHTHWATALEPSSITSVKRDDFLDGLSRRPDLLHQFVDLLIGRLVSAYAEVEARVFETVVQRLSRRLLQLPVTSTEGGWALLPRSFGHGELARLLGVKRETVTRAMQHLRQIGVVDVPDHRGVRVHPERLRRLLSDSRDRRIAED